MHTRQVMLNLFGMDISDQSGGSFVVTNVDLERLGAAARDAATPSQLKDTQVAEFPV